MNEPTTSSTGTNVTVTYTGWTGWMRRAHIVAGWWGIADALGHKLHLPDRLMRPICDRYDIECGIPKADLIRMDYTGQGKRTPWWLR